MALPIPPTVALRAGTTGGGAFLTPIPLPLPLLARSNSTETSLKSNGSLPPGAETSLGLTTGVVPLLGVSVAQVVSSSSQGLALLVALVVVVRLEGRS